MSTENNITPETQEVKPSPTPIAKWVHDGESVLITRFCKRDGTNFGEHSFQYPVEVGKVATAPDWKSSAGCGNGLHGWPWGMFVGDGKDPEWDALWQVYAAKPEDVIECDGPGKVKFRTGTLVYSGDWMGAWAFTLAGHSAYAWYRAKYAHENASGSAANSGDYGSAANSGDYGSAANSGYCGAAISTATDSKAKSAAYGCIALAWRNKEEDRHEMRAAEIGCGDGSDGKLKADTWYKLDADGKFVEAAQ